MSQKNPSDPRGSEEGWFSPLDKDFRNQSTAGYRPSASPLNPENNVNRPRLSEHPQGAGSTHDPNMRTTGHGTTPHYKVIELPGSSSNSASAHGFTKNPPLWDSAHVQRSRENPIRPFHSPHTTPTYRQPAATQAHSETRFIPGKQSYDYVDDGHPGVRHETAFATIVEPPTGQQQPADTAQPTQPPPQQPAARQNTLKGVRLAGESTIGCIVAAKHGSSTELFPLLPGRWVVTSSPDSQSPDIGAIHISDPSVSSSHALMRVEPGGRIAVVDQASEFGTWIRRKENGAEERLGARAVELKDGDVIQFGQRAYKVVLF